MASLTQLAGPRIDFELIGNVCFGGVVLWMQRERVRKVVWEPILASRMVCWCTLWIFPFYESMSLFLFGTTLIWLYFILSLSLSDARCIGLIVSNGRIPGVEQTERLLPQGDIRTMGISPITFFRRSNVFRQEIGWLNLCVDLSVDFWQLPESFVTKAIAKAEANGVGPATLYSAQKVPRALNVRRTYRLLDVCPRYNMGYSILQLQQT